MNRLTFQIEGGSQTAAALDKIDLSFRDFRPLFRDAGRVFYEIEKEAFATEGASTQGGKWRPLSPVYGKFKAIKRPGKTLLRFDDDLYKSLTQPNAPGSTFKIEDNEADFGTTSKTAIWHQFGTRRMPARPVIDMTPAQEKKMAKVIRDGLLAFINRAGFIVSVEVE